MKRKKKQRSLEDLFELAGILPWWLSLIIATVSYFLLHHFATASIDAPQATGTSINLSNMYVEQMTRAISTPLQYLVPSVFLLGTMSAFIGKHRRRALFDSVREDRTLFVNLTWQQFEVLVGEAFRQKGYAVSELGGKGRDRGIDLALTREGELYLVQCKHWKTGRVPVTVVRELLGVMTAQGAKGGFVVASDGFTADSEAFAKQCTIDLVGGRASKAMIDSARTSTDLSNITPLVSQNPPEGTTPAEPYCPSCGSSMVLRTARKGPNVGDRFWGCTRFPKCREIVPIP